MDSLVNIQEKMSSREISDLTGKNHSHVCRDIRSLNDVYAKIAQSKIGSCTYTDPNNRPRLEFMLSRLQTLDLMTGYNPELRIKIIRRWEELESNHKKNNLDIADPNVLLQLAQNYANKCKEVEKANSQIARLAPKADLADQITNTDTVYKLSEVCKALGLPYGNVTLFRKLRERGIIFKNGREPMQKYVTSGHFVIKLKPFVKPDGKDAVSKMTYVTGKGLAYIKRILCAPEQHELQLSRST